MPVKFQLLTPHHTNTFLKVFFSSSRRKRSKIFVSTIAFSYRFHLSMTGTWDCACANITRPSAILDRCSDLDWKRWHVTLFSSPFSKVSVFTSNDVFGRFSVDDWRKRIKKHVFSNENAFVFIGFSK